MEPFDQEMARRVWQRVRDTPCQPPLLEPEGGDLPGLILRRLTDAAAYRQLAADKREGAALGALAAAARSQALCLRGLEMLLSGNDSPAPLPAPSLGEPESLRRRILRETQWQNLCRERSAGEWGFLFQQFAEQSQRHLPILLEMLAKKPDKSRPR